MFGNCEIDPRIYTILELDPFKCVSSGKNIIHMMCLTDASDLLGDFLAYFYERCHTEPFYLKNNKDKEWEETKYIFDKKNKKKIPNQYYQHFLDGLNKGEEGSLNTAGHYCVI